MTSSKTGSEPEMPHPGSGRKETGGLSPSPEGMGQDRCPGGQGQACKSRQYPGG